MAETAADLRTQARMLEAQRDELVELLRVHERALPIAVREATVGIRKEADVAKVVRQRADLKSEVATLTNRIKVLHLAAEEADADELARLARERKVAALRLFVEWNEVRKDALRLWAEFDAAKARVPGGFNVPLVSDDAQADWAASQLRSLEHGEAPVRVSFLVGGSEGRRTSTALAAVSLAGDVG